MLRTAKQRTQVNSNHTALTDRHSKAAPLSFKTRHSTLLQSYSDPWPCLKLLCRGIFLDSSVSNSELVYPYAEKEIISSPHWHTVDKEADHHNLRVHAFLIVKYHKMTRSVWHCWTKLNKNQLRFKPHLHSLQVSTTKFQFFSANLSFSEWCKSQAASFLLGRGAAGWPTPNGVNQRKPQLPSL